MQGFLTFTEKLSRKAQGEARRVFQQSEEVIKEELKWFESLGAARGLDVFPAISFPDALKLMMHMYALANCRTCSRNHQDLPQLP